MEPFRTNEELRRIVQRYLNGKATAEEQKLLEAWDQHIDAEHDAFASISSAERKEMKDTIQQRVRAGKHPEDTRKLNRTRWLSVAAAVLVFALCAYLFWSRVATDTSPQVALEDIGPGGNKAVLTLADGQTINLDSVGSGALAQQAGAAISKTEDGIIAYAHAPAADDPQPQPSFNSITTPKGGQYRLVLSDGTKVWINAASKLKYPIHFTTGERMVELEGEAYFEVAPDVDRPFRVVSRGQTVEVLGTSFNVNAYADEGYTATILVNGVINVRTATHNKRLKPGQLSRVVDQQIAVSQADTTLAVAWKNGKFIFDNLSVSEAMRQLARWYDLELVYKGDVTHLQFAGSVNRYADFKDVLHTLELTEAVNFDIEGRRVTIMP